MNQFTLKSNLAPLFYNFLKYRKALKKWSSSYESNLIRFDKYCLESYPLEITLQQVMLNEWFQQSETEIAASTNTRTSVIRALAQYYNSFFDKQLIIPEYLKELNSTYMPYPFIQEQLQNFFIKCDSIKFNTTIISKRTKPLIISAIIRLLYSSGIRTCEARLLLKDQVNLNTGVLNVINTKGYNQHFVVMHESMRLYLKEYDKNISIFYPNRKYFFPNRLNGYYCRTWLQNNFNVIWMSCEYPRVNIYDLRHNYATININKLINEPNFNSKFYYLSKSMGHSTLESTKYYYSLTSKIAIILKNIEEDSFNDIVPGE